MKCNVRKITSHPWWEHTSSTYLKLVNHIRTRTPPNPEDINALKELIECRTNLKPEV